MDAPLLPTFRPVAGDFARHVAAEHGDRLLAVLGDDRLTYAEADRRSAGLAKGLLASGVGKGTRVGLLAPNGPDWIVAWLAASRIGAVVALLNTYAQPRELGWALRHSDTAVLVTVPAHLGHDYLVRLAEAAPGIERQPHERIRVPSQPHLRAVWLLGATRGEDVSPVWAGAVDDLVARGQEIDDALLLAAEAEVCLSDPMVVIYTSGSTGEPKGAIHTHGAVVRHGLNLSQYRELRAGERVYTPMPFFWVGGLSFVLVRAMHAGATVVCEERFEPAATLALLERERVTHVLAWPHVGAALAAHPDAPRRDLSSLRVSSAPELLPAVERRADAGPVASSLGMTETLGPHLIDHEGQTLPEAKRGSLGRPVAGLEHRVVDEDGHELPPGQPGELWVRGYSLMAGFHKREREHVFTADGWYPTGDLGQFDDDGYFYFTGRRGDLIKSRGMNVSPQEVEQVLQQQPEVSLAVVVGIPAGAAGEDVAAAVVVGGDSDGRLCDVTAAELTERLRRTLSAYKVPRHLVLFRDDENLPLLNSGKVDRRALADVLAKRATSSD